jgi:hypothetical protein
VEKNFMAIRRARQSGQTLAGFGTQQRGTSARKKYAKR